MKQYENRAYLLHLTHYDPAHMPGKPTETPFDLSVCKAVVDAVAGQGFNLLIIAIADAVRYQSHPELARHYSQSPELLSELVGHAKELGLEVVPKLNFSQSAINCHNNWMRAEGETWFDLFDDEGYWQRGFDCIDEAIDICKPERYFHVGMDEDHNRSYTQFVAATRTLYEGLKDRGLATLSWSDSALTYPTANIYVEKCRAVEKQLPNDLVRILWDYGKVPEEAMQWLKDCGNTFWVAPGTNDMATVREFRDKAKDYGCSGVVMTNWCIAHQGNQERLLSTLKEYGPVYNADFG